MIYLGMALDHLSVQGGGLKMVHERNASVSSGSAVTHDPLRVSHTPGPWEEATDELEGTDSYGLCIIGDGDIICDLYEHMGSCYERFANCEANARLIASAPDLLATLKALMHHARSFGVFRDDMGEGVERYCNEVIAKAEGKTE